MRRATVLLVGVVLVSLLWGAPAGAVHAPKVALVYGDSLTWESWIDINADVAIHPNLAVQVHSLGYTSPCVWTQWLPADLAKYHPSIVTVESAGNGYLAGISDCMVDATGTPLADGSPGYFANYTASLSALFSEATASGARVLFLEGPPMLDPTRNADVIQIGQIAQSLAGQYPGVTISTAPRLAVSNGGTYADYMHCLKTETAAMGCTKRQIAVRTVATGWQLGLHFCPGGLPLAYPWFCSTYSSGEYRWAKAVVKATVGALG